jgi:hypothetical protein
MQIQQKVVEIEQKNTEITKLRDRSELSTSKLKQKAEQDASQRVAAEKKFDEAQQARKVIEEEAAKRVADMQQKLQEHKQEAAAAQIAKVAALESTLQTHRQQIEDIGRHAKSKCTELENRLRENEIETNKHKKQALNSCELELRTQLMQAIVDKDLDCLKRALKEVDELLPASQNSVE